MTWGAVAVGGASLLGGVLANQSARKAGDVQAAAAQDAAAKQLQATQESNALQWNMFQQGIQNQAPFLQGGQSAYAALLGGMGLGAPRAAGTPASSTPQGMYVNAEGQPVDAQGNVITGSPYQVGNYGATQAEMDAAAAGQLNAEGAGRFTETFKPSDITQDPSYQWRLEQGLRAMKGQQSGKGLLGSSQSMNDLQTYGQGLASTEYQAAYDRFMKNQETAYGRLSSLAGLGTNTAGNIATGGANTAGNIANTTMTGANAMNNWLTGGAAAQAGGMVGGANAITGGINNGIRGGLYWNALQNQGTNNSVVSPSSIYGNQGQFYGVGNTGLTGPG